MNCMRTWLGLVESLQDWNDGRWVHYSQFEMLTINPKPFHQDPLGIYCFPEKFEPHTMWRDMKYKFVITIKSDARILDYGDMTDADIEALLKATKASDEFAAYEKQYPSKNRSEYVRKLWECMRSSMILGGGGSRAKWNKIFRDLGWDALFDDTGTVHSNEVQLLIFNPRIITHVERFNNGTSGFEEMKRVMKDVVDLCSHYGVVTTEGPKKLRVYRHDPKILKAIVRVERSEDNYAEFEIRYDHLDSNRKSVIGINLRWSRPSLSYGVGAAFDIHKRRYQEYSDLERLKTDLDKIFAE